VRIIFLLTLNTLKVAFRKKSNYIVFFLLPVIGILVSMVASNHSGPGSLSLGVLNRDSGAIADDMIASLGRENRFKITPLAEKDLENAVTAGRVDCVLVIPRGFGEGIVNNHFNKLELVSIKGEAATAWISGYLNAYCANLLEIAGAAGGNDAAFHSIYQGFRQEQPALQVSAVADNATSKELTSQSIGFLIMFMLIGAGSTAQTILKEKIDRTFYRICAAPVSGRAYVTGNVLASLAIVTVQILLTLLLLSRLFHVNTLVPAPKLFLILAVFGLAAVGLNLLIVAYAGNSSQAGTLQVLVVTPTCLLAGCFWPLEIMPEAARRMAGFLPQTWTIEAIRKLQEGGSLGQITLHLAIILAFALAFFLAAAYGFGRKDGVKSFI
jgi:ABC-2 type transport system permease protein